MVAGYAHVRFVLRGARVVTDRLVVRDSVRTDASVRPTAGEPSDPEGDFQGGDQGMLLA